MKEQSVLSVKLTQVAVAMRDAGIAADKSEQSARALISKKFAAHKRVLREYAIWRPFAALVKGGAATESRPRAYAILLELAREAWGGLPGADGKIRKGGKGGGMTLGRFENALTSQADAVQRNAVAFQKYAKKTENVELDKLNAFMTAATAYVKAAAVFCKYLHEEREIEAAVKAKKAA
jgi:hypothetical protein